MMPLKVLCPLGMCLNTKGDHFKTIKKISMNKEEV